MRFPLPVAVHTFLWDYRVVHLSVCVWSLWRVVWGVIIDYSNI